MKSPDTLNKGMKKMISKKPTDDFNSDRLPQEGNEQEMSFSRIPSISGPNWPPTNVSGRQSSN